MSKDYMMIINTKQEHREWYEQGHLDYVLHNLQKQYAVEDWKEFLKHEPIGYFTDKKHWTIDNDIITYQDDEDEEVYQVSMTIELPNGETLLHSAEAPQSMFFHITHDNNKLEMIYVD